MLYHKYKPLASRVYCTGLALLLVLSEVFSSNVQDTLPGFSRIMRLGLTGCAVLLLAGKIILLTGPNIGKRFSRKTRRIVTRWNDAVAWNGCVHLPPVGQCPLPAGIAIFLSAINPFFGEGYGRKRILEGAGEDFRNG